MDPSANRNYDFIDGLRGIAILMVLFCHHLYVNPDAGPAGQYLGAFGSAAGGGVRLFFAISGFLISWPFWKRKFSGSAQAIPGGYFRRRFWKIYPPLALSIVFLVPCYLVLTHDPAYLSLGAEWLAGLPFLLPVSGKLNPVMWTLVVEVQFYLLLPLIFASLKRVPPKACLWIVTGVFLVVPVIYRGITGYHATFRPNIDSHFPAALDYFSFGILLGGLEAGGFMRKEWARFGAAGFVLWPLALFASAGLIFTSPASAAFGSEAVYWVEWLGSGMLLCYVANPRLRIPQLLCAPWLRWCGIVSYEWYLIHQPLAGWTRQLAGPAGGNALKFLAITGGPLVVSGTLAAVVYRYFSLPLLQFGRGRRAAKPVPAAGEAAA